MESCVIYARFSSHGQNEQSIEAQVRICKEFAESKGLKTINTQEKLKFLKRLHSTFNTRLFQKF